jgi:hypothetical protein
MDLADRLNVSLLRHDKGGDREVGILVSKRDHAALPVFGADNQIAAIFKNLNDGLAHDVVVVDD